MSGAYRLPRGGRIDRSRRLRFTWAGKTLHGYAGDTLASALVANGLRVLGRSFKYHRPRGLIGTGVEESNVLVQLGEGARSTANVRATEVRLHDGLVARPVNCWPNARFDLAGAIGLASRFLPAGFYYKTFMWPDWHLFEGIIRRLAGLGTVAAAPDPDRYESRFAHCDVLVVGAGPAGLSAARAAAAGGARVILAEQDSLPGGALLHDAAIVDGQSGEDWAAATLREIEAAPAVRVLLRTAVVGYHDHNSLTLVEQVGDDAACAADPTVPRTRTWVVRARHVVLATGALERPVVFPGNDRPGVMLAAASRHYIRRYAALPGRRAVVFTNNDDAYRTALALHDAGVGVVVVVDVRRDIARDLAVALSQRGIRVVAGGAVVATRGWSALAGVCVRDAGGREEWLNCDHLAMSGGYNPTSHLFSQSGGALRYDPAIAAFVPGTSVQREVSVGAAAGQMTTAAALADGHAAGLAAAAAAPGAPRVPMRVAAPERAEAPLQPCWHVEAPGKAFVDFQNDVSVDDIALSARENFRSVEHLKRYTTLGMAPDQGKTSNVNALAIMGDLTGRSVADTGYTRYRFPFIPVALGTMMGRATGELFRPLRRMPAHDRHVSAGATMEDYGGWSRPANYRGPDESAATAERREALAVRTAAGVFEGSPLGKIEIVGRDAGRFLDLVYANTMSTLKPGKVRYGLMLDELGVVIDDGVATRLAEDRFLIGTSSGGAARILAHLEEWLQCEWPGLDVIVAPLTEAWGVLTLTGAAARGILRRVGTSIDLDDFPHMSFAEGVVAGLPARVFRVSYTGETSYEINVPGRRTVELWDALFAASPDLTPIGIEAWMILRTEKGYLHIGADTDGTTSALDVGWGHVLKKPVDFIGKRSLLRTADQHEDRLQFVGFAVPGGAPRLPVGAHVVEPAEGGGLTSAGYVSSSVDSATLGHPVALGMLRGGRARVGERVQIGIGGSNVFYEAVVTAPTFYDPDGERLRG